MTSSNGRSTSERSIFPGGRASRNPPPMPRQDSSSPSRTASRRMRDKNRAGTFVFDATSLASTYRSGFPWARNTIARRAYSAVLEITNHLSIGKANMTWLQRFPIAPTATENTRIRQTQRVLASRCFGSQPRHAPNTLGDPPSGSIPPGWVHSVQRNGVDFETRKNLSLDKRIVT